MSYGKTAKPGRGLLDFKSQAGKSLRLHLIVKQKPIVLEESLWRIGNDHFAVDNNFRHAHRDQRRRGEGSEGSTRPQVVLYRALITIPGCPLRSGDRVPYRL